MEILKLWILKGVIMDAEHEFLIEENEKECSPDLNQNYFSDYWEKRYVIRQDIVPRFLEKQVDVILRTGKKFFSAVKLFNKMDIIFRKISERNP